MQMCVKERGREWATGGAEACEMFLLCCCVVRVVYSFCLTNFVNQCEVQLPGSTAKVVFHVLYKITKN